MSLVGLSLHIHVRMSVQHTAYPLPCTKYLTTYNVSACANYLPIIQQLPGCSFNARRGRNKQEGAGTSKKGQEQGRRGRNKEEGAGTRKKGQEQGRREQLQ